MTDIGLFRDTNQDLFEFGEFDDQNCWAVVCDGMGGASGGETASRICVEKVSVAIKRGYHKNFTVKAARNLLESAITSANMAVYDLAVQESSLRGMGTTVVAVIVLGGIAVIAHVGDSRAYHLTSDSVKLVTKDHSLMQAMIDNGKITEEEAKTHPDRNVITRAIGVVNFVDVDFDVIDLNEGEKLLVCTDGLSGSIESEEMLEIVNANSDFSAEKLVERALVNGSRDNVTVVVMSTEDQGA